MPFTDSGSIEILSVTQLTRTVKRLLEDEFPFIQVEGEISNFIRHPSGHMYFSLKDATAQISCVMWRGKNSNLLFRPEDGMKIIASGRITLYERQGRYQLDVDRIQAVGQGALQRSFEQLKKKLDSEGLFSAEHKKPIPAFPRVIGIVTSPSGAALRDIVSVIQRRYPIANLILRPVRVQGNTAAAEIAEAIIDFNDFGDTDVLIVGRGGGSAEDLWAFNEEIVARAIFASQIPVISAVGHEIDFSISDFVADKRAPTPSVAAEIAVPDRAELFMSLDKLRERLIRTMSMQLSRLTEMLQRLKQSYGLHQPVNKLKELYFQLDDMSRSLKQIMTKGLLSAANQLDLERERLKALSPLNVLERGYSITTNTKTGKIITNSSVLQADLQIITRFASGSSVSEIIEVTNEVDLNGKK